MAKRVERTKSFAARTVKLAKYLNEQKMFSSADQIIRSGTSIEANVHEAQSSESKKDFAHKMNIALKEAQEIKYWFYVITESGLVKSDRMKELKSELDELIRMLTSIIKSTRKSIKEEVKK